jgi:hypothetical protein
MAKSNSAGVQGKPASELGEEDASNSEGVTGIEMPTARSTTSVTQT